MPPNWAARRGRRLSTTEKIRKALLSSTPIESTLKLYAIDPKRFVPESPSIAQWYRGWLSKLPRDVAEKIAYKNLVRFLGTSFPWITNWHAPKGAWILGSPRLATGLGPLPLALGHPVRPCIAKRQAG